MNRRLALVILMGALGCQARRTEMVVGVVSDGLVVPDDVTVEIVQGSASEEVSLTLDGQIGFQLQHRDAVVVRRAAHMLPVITSPKRNYFEVLRTKLKWGER